MWQEFIKWLKRVIGRANSVDAANDVFNEGLNWNDVLWLTPWRVDQVFALLALVGIVLVGTGELPAFIIASLGAVFFVGGVIFGMLKKDAAAIKQEQTGDVKIIVENKHKQHPNNQIIQNELSLLRQNPADIITNRRSLIRRTVDELPLITDHKTSIVYKIDLTRKDNCVRLSTTKQGYAPAHHALNVQNGGDEESGLLAVANSKPARSCFQHVTKFVYQVSDSYPGKVFINLWNTVPMVLWASPILGWGFSTLYAGPDAANNTDNLHLLPAAIYGPVAFIATYTGAKIASYCLQPKKTEQELKDEKENKKELRRVEQAAILLGYAIDHELNMQALKSKLPSSSDRAPRTDIKSLPPAKMVKPPIAPNDQYMQSTWLETLIPIAIKLSGSSIIANFGAWEGSNVAGLIELLLQRFDVADDLINKYLQLKVMACATNLIGVPSTIFFASNQQYQRQKLTARAKQILSTVINDGTQETLFDSLQTSQDTLATNRQIIKNFKADIRRMAATLNLNAEDYIPKIKIMKDFTDLKDELTRSFIEKMDRGITLFGRIGGGIYWWRFYMMYLLDVAANYWHFGGASIVGALLAFVSHLNFACGDNFEFKKQLVNGLFEAADFVLKQQIGLSEKYIEVLQHKHAELKIDEMENARLRSIPTVANESTPLLRINKS